MSNTTLEGRFLDEPTNKFRIGIRLGSGACGVVHELNTSTTSKAVPSKVLRHNEDPKHYAIKLAPYTAQALTASSKKKKKTTAERNADLLYQESLLYRGLQSLRGSVIPLVPLTGKPPIFGEIPGYRYVVMEQMEQTLYSILPSLIDNSPKQKSGSDYVIVALNDIVSTILSHIQAVHSLNYLVVDIKPENIMLAFDTGNSSIESRIRLVDIALFESFKDATTQKHRADVFPAGAVVGTPTYASLNVLNGHGVSRRDDLEAIGYVFMEMIMLLLSYSEKDDGHDSENRLSSAERKRKTNTISSSDIHLLPWSHGTSDDEIKRLKDKAVKELIGLKCNTSPRAVSSTIRGKKTSEAAGSSVLFDAMSFGNNYEAANAMKEYMSIVTALNFSEKPDYDELMHCLSHLKIKLRHFGKVKEKKAAQETKPEKHEKARVIKKRVTTTTVEEYFEIDDESLNPQPIQWTSAASKKIVSSKVIDNQYEEMEMISARASLHDDEETFKTCDTGHEMDWEQVSCTTKVSKMQDMDKENKHALVLHVTEGPHAGESYPFSTTFLLGRLNDHKSSPSRTPCFDLTKDNQVSTSHAKIVPHVSKQGVHSLCLTDFKTSTGTFVNDRLVPSGRARQVFIGDKIKVGSTVIRVKKA